MAPECDCLIESLEAAHPRHLGQLVQRLAEPTGKPSADANDHTAAREQVDRSNRLRGLNRSAQHRHQGRGAKLDPMRERRKRCEHRQSLDTRTEQRVVDPDGGEAELLSANSQLKQLAWISALTPLRSAGGQQDTNMELMVHAW